MGYTYRQRFAQASEPARYDAVYAAGSYIDRIWGVEQTQLLSILETMRASHSHIDYLDFAAGTGRVTSFMEDKVDTATGIEISEAMLAKASQRVKRAKLICADITAADAPIEGQYDLITSFRFILNAEPALRLAALKGLAARLKDESSRLVVNNHGNLLSYKAWSHGAVGDLCRLRHPHRPTRNWMTHGQVRRLLDEVGLEIVSILGSDFLSAAAARWFGIERIMKWERRFARRPALWRVASSVMYVARLKSHGARRG